MFVLIDARHGLADSDSALIGFLKQHRVSWKVVVNKSDLVDPNVLAKRITSIANQLKIGPSTILQQIIPVSALRVQGIEPLRRLVETFKLKRDIVIAGRHTRVIDLLEERRLRKKILPTRNNTKASSCEIDTAAYVPDETDIVKIAKGDPTGDIRLLDVKDFISKDEQVNLGLRRGANANVTLTAHDWKTQLELVSNVVPSPRPTSNQAGPSALGYISTYNPIEVPKGIAKWKVMGKKPAIKTSRFRAKPDMAVHLVKTHRKSAQTDTHTTHS